MSYRDSQRSTLVAGGKEFDYFSIADLPGIERLPYSDEDVDALLNAKTCGEAHEIQFTPSRVIMQDFTGVPCIVDLATMRDAVKNLGGDPKVINPQVPAQMVIDHSVQIDVAGVDGAIEKNMDIEYARNKERYQFLRWGQQAFDNFRVVPPGTGIIHQVNVEYLAKVVMTKTDVSRLLRGNRFSYDNRKRLVGSRLGSRRNRSRSCDARTAGFNACSQGCRFQTDRVSRQECYCHGYRSYDYGYASPSRSCGQIR